MVISRQDCLTAPHNAGPGCQAAMACLPFYMAWVYLSEDLNSHWEGGEHLHQHLPTVRIGGTRGLPLYGGAWQPPACVGCVVRAAGLVLWPPSAGFVWMFTLLRNQPSAERTGVGAWHNPYVSQTTGTSLSRANRDGRRERASSFPDKPSLVACSKRALQSLMDRRYKHPTSAGWL